MCIREVREEEVTVIKKRNDEIWMRIRLFCTGRFEYNVDLCDKAEGGVIDDSQVMGLWVAGRMVVIANSDEE